jgi:UDP-N-acetyl-D-mannosaminouronate:lipid I N-acetyl-D-mannosaminouronosyltransferase
MPPDIVSVNGVNIFLFDQIEELLSFIDERKHGILIAINSGKIHKATDVTREIINKNIGYIDGVGALYAVRKKGQKKGIVITGCDLWIEIVKKYSRDKSFYLVGAKQDVIEKTVEKLEKEFPGINIKNYRNGYFYAEDETKILIEDIIAKKPDIIFVGMGSPKQEFLMQKINEQYPALYQGIGGSFDIYAGILKRAPKWLIDHRLEGFHRVFTDISIYRLKRMINDMLFVVKVFFGVYR